MGLNEWKYAFDRVLQWSKWNGKTSVLLRIAAIFPDNRELFGNESNKKKKNLFKLRFVVFVFLFEARGAGGENMVRRPFSVFTALTYRWHHWSRRFIQVITTASEDQCARNRKHFFKDLFCSARCKNINSSTLYIFLNLYLVCRDNRKSSISTSMQKCVAGTACVTF